MLDMHQERTTIAVIGAGLMGTCIAGELAYHGQRVRVYDRSSTAYEKAQAILAQHKEHLRREELILTPDFVGTITFCSSLEDAVQNAAFVFETVIEDLKVKQSIFEKTSQHCLPDTVIATNTITLDVNSIAQQTTDPTRCLGIRFLYPVYCIPEVEITLSNQTSQQTIQKVRRLLEGMNKTLFFRSGNKPLVLTHSQVEDRKQAQRERMNNLLNSGQANTHTLPSLGSSLNHGTPKTGHGQVMEAATQREGVSTTEKDTECVVCMDNRRDTVLCPCHHLCVCRPCSATLQDNRDNCPICRNGISSVIHVYQP